MTTRAFAGGVSVDILVSPKASRARFGPVHGDRIKVFVTSPPVDGQANAAVLDLLRKTFGVAKSDLTITSGLSSRRKTVRITGVAPAQIDEATG